MNIARKIGSWWKREKDENKYYLLYIASGSRQLLLKLWPDITFLSKAKNECEAIESIKDHPKVLALKDRVVSVEECTKKHYELELAKQQAFATKEAEFNKWQECLKSNK